MQVVHGYKHVDGDGPLKHCTVDPKYREMTKDMLQFLSATSSIKGREDKWGPYFVEIARRTVEAAKDNDKVVLSHATYKEDMRDLAIQEIVKGGEIYMDKLNFCICAHDMSQNSMPLTTRGDTILYTYRCTSGPYYCY